MHPSFGSLKRLIRLEHFKGGPRSRVCARKNSKSPPPYFDPKILLTPQKGGGGFRICLIKFLAISDNSDHFSFFQQQKNLNTQIITTLDKPLMGEK
jgi:hypothetical protein